VKIAFLFPGQGSELPGMGLDLAGRSEAARALLERAEACAEQPLRLALQRGGAALARTELLQPALTGVCLGVAGELLRAGVSPDVVAGHSLGELSAAAAAGWLTPHEAVELACIRGRLMGLEAARHPGGMLALSPGTEAELDRALAIGRRQGVLDVAARNGSDEWVLSGEHSALRAVQTAVPCVPLRVSGAWHSRLMAGAVEPFRQSLRASLAGPREGRPMLSGLTGGLVESTPIADLLADALTRQVCWTAVLHAITELGVTDVVTVGPGKVVRGLTRRALGDTVRLHATDRPRDLDSAVEALA
jgi:[acyl-carrier-protein] S-malonyltransferase